MWQIKFLCQGRDFETDFKDKKRVTVKAWGDLISAEHLINQVRSVELLGSLISSTWRLSVQGLVVLWVCLLWVSPGLSQGFIHSLESSLKPPQTVSKHFRSRDHFPSHLASVYFSCEHISFHVDSSVLTGSQDYAGLRASQPGRIHTWSFSAACLSCI